MSKENCKYSRGLTYYIAGVGILFDHGTTVPTDGTADYAPGCIFQHTDGTGDGVLYVNQGTLSSCDFNALDAISLEAANMTIADSGSYFTATTVEAALAEIGALRYGAGGTAAGRGPSPLIWANCPVMDYILNPQLGMHYFNDFHAENAVLTNNKTVQQISGSICGFTAATSGSNIAMNADEPTGVITLKTTTDNEDAGICILGGLNTAGQVKFTSGKKLWFEARIKSLNITDSKFGIFCGFAEEGLCATTALISDAGALPDKDYVGFHKLEADGDKLDTVHRKAGGAAVSVKTDAITLVADTYKKIGIYCDGTTVYFYADGVLLADTALLETATFPTAEELAFYFVAMAASADDAESSIDWVRIAQEF